MTITPSERLSIRRMTMNNFAALPDDCQHRLVARFLTYARATPANGESKLSVEAKAYGYADAIVELLPQPTTNLPLFLSLKGALKVFPPLGAGASREAAGNWRAAIVTHILGFLRNA